MNLIYLFSINLYGLAIKCAALLGNKKAQEKAKNLNFSLLKEKKKFDWWFHCASLGEFEQGRPLIERVRVAYPEARLLLTFFSPSGYEIRKNYPMVDFVAYLPLDTPTNARAFLDSFEIKRAVFVKYEFWYQILRELSSRKIPTYLICAHFVKTNNISLLSIYYKKIFEFFKIIFVQTTEDKVLIENKFHLPNVFIAGDTRFDRVLVNAQTNFKNDFLELFCKNAFVVVCGSVWSPDIKALQTLLEDNLLSKLKLIMVPHEIDEKLISQEAGVFYSARERYDSETLEKSHVAWIDCVGLLSRIYRFGAVCYIGGGFGKGIHNTLEAAIYGKPVLFGPNFHRFKEAKDLIANGGGYSVRDASALLTLIKSFYVLWINKIPLPGIEGKEYVEANSGATDKIFEIITQREIFTQPSDESAKR